MLCPRCNVDLLLSEKQGIEIDYCPKCRGIWLDRGELDKIIERSIPVESDKREIPYERNREQSNHHYDEDDHHKYGDKYSPHRRKKGFLGDLFDF